MKKIPIQKKLKLRKEDIQEIAIFENNFISCKSLKSNIVQKVKNITNKDLNRHYKKDENFGGIYCYKFYGNANLDAKTLCMFATKLLLNINLQKVSQNNILNILNKALEFCDFDLLDIAIGCVNPTFAMSSILNYNNNLKNNNLILSETRIDDYSIFFMEGIENLNYEQKQFYYALQNKFRSSICSSILLEKENKNYILYNKKNTGFDNYEYISNKANSLYDATDFYGALFYFNQLKKSSKKLTIEQLFKYADCLNHCGSMQHSKENFEKVLKIGNKNNEKELMLMNEAQTEIFNLRFWQMDVKNLVSDIDCFLQQNIIPLKVTSDKRGLYSYYNLLNRKMVTLYLQGLYEEAEIVYKFILNETNKDYQNYLAFAHMDSARGLYKTNIKEAYKRLNYAKKILSELNTLNKEKRRYLDCLVEIEYLKFIINYSENNTASIKPLEEIVFKVKISGYKNMLLKCYLKLATCYISIKDLKKADMYLSFVKRNGDFQGNKRLKFLYYNIISKFYLVKNMILCDSENVSEDYIEESIICFNSIPNGKILLESRIW